MKHCHHVTWVSWPVRVCVRVRVCVCDKERDGRGDEVKVMKNMHCKSVCYAMGRPGITTCAKVSHKYIHARTRTHTYMAARVLERA